MKNNITKILLKTFLVVLFWCSCLITVNTQTNKLNDEPFDSPTNRITCGEWINYINDAARRWKKNEDSSFIVIARLGDGETLRRINLKRIKTLKEYILDEEFKKKVVFAEGERVKELGIIEFYVEGKLLYSLPVSRNKDIPLKFCKP